MAFYELNLIKGLIRDGNYWITVSAEQTAMALGFYRDDVCDCILNHLTDANFYKAMPADKGAGLVAGRLQS